MGVTRRMLEDRLMWIPADDTGAVLVQFAESEPAEVRSRVLSFLESGAEELALALFPGALSRARFSFGPFGRLPDIPVGILTTRWLGCNPKTKGHDTWIERVFVEKQYHWSDILMTSGDVRRATEITDEPPTELSDFISFALDLRAAEHQYEPLAQLWRPTLVNDRPLPFSVGVLRLFLWWSRIHTISGREPYPSEIVETLELSKTLDTFIERLTQ